MAKHIVTKDIHNFIEADLGEWGKDVIISDDGVDGFVIMQTHVHQSTLASRVLSEKLNSKPYLNFGHTIKLEVVIEMMNAEKFKHL